MCTARRGPARDGAILSHTAGVRVPSVDKSEFVRPRCTTKFRLSGRSASVTTLAQAHYGACGLKVASMVSTSCDLQEEPSRLKNGVDALIVTPASESTIGMESARAVATSANYREYICGRSVVEIGATAAPTFDGTIFEQTTRMGETGCNFLKGHTGRRRCFAKGVVAPAKGASIQLETASKHIARRHVGECSHGSGKLPRGIRSPADDLTIGGKRAGMVTARSDLGEGS